MGEEGKGSSLAPVLVWDSGFRVGLRVKGLGFWVQGAGFRV